MPPKKTYTYVRSMLAIRSGGKPFIVNNHSAEDLALSALELLVYELGTDGAKEFCRKKLSEYLQDYKGLGRDDRELRETIPTFQNPTMHGVAPGWGQHTADREGSSGIRDGKD